MLRTSKKLPNLVKKVPSKLSPIGNKVLGLNKFNVKAISIGVSNIGVALNKIILDSKTFTFI